MVGVARSNNLIERILPFLMEEAMQTLQKIGYKILKKIFRILECTDQQKVRFAAFKLSEEAKRWWNSEKVIRETEGTGLIAWAQFKQNFFDRFFPKADREARAQLVHKAMLVEQNIKRGAELQEQRKRAAPQGFQSLDQGQWKRRNEGSSSSQRQIQGNHTSNPCKFCDRIHHGECRKEVGSCFKCSKDGHFIRECPLFGVNNRRPNPAQNFRPNNQGNNQRRTVPARVFALTPGEAEDKDDVITGIVPLFLNKAIVLFDSGATHSFISMDYVKLCPIVANEMDYNLRVSTPTGDIVTCNKILLKCPITISGKEMPANLIVFPMIGVRTPPSVISAFQVDKLLRDGCQGYLAFVVDEPKEELKLEEIPIVREYTEVFPEDLSGLPPEREVEFAIELTPGTVPLSKAPYQMAPSELAELKKQLQDLLDKGLPRTPTGQDAIWVIVDRLTKIAHFVPIRVSYKLEKLAELYIQEIVRLHGIDGQSERTIQILEDMLRAFMLDFKGSWIRHLPLVEFAYNNSY
ncbi:uncharacterized protein LOC118345037 [Juglans regia]|uniref:Uncharacterized protein LOC118345037 n=1 Tax=Juglans regia TaxID=51240 RepID=A0A6P9EJ61_JUGRE|nr:uncharacterized protein LOC118345037 [Juglans regia]